MSDNYQVINCPACGKQMKKIFLTEIGVNIDICTDGCGGIYLDNREYEKLDEKHEHVNQVIQEIENADFSHVKVDEDAIRVCPVCGTNMVKNQLSVKGKIIIDECYSCGGKFLDHGELTKIREEYPAKKERSEVAMKAFLYSPRAAEMNYLSISSIGVRGRSTVGRLFSALFRL